MLLELQTWWQHRSGRVLVCGCPQRCQSPETTDQLSNALFLEIRICNSVTSEPHPHLLINPAKQQQGGHLVQGWRHPWGSPYVTIRCLGSSLSSFSHSAFLLRHTLEGSRRRSRTWVPVILWDTWLEIQVSGFASSKLQILFPTSLCLSNKIKHFNSFKSQAISLILDGLLQCLSKHRS